MASQRQIGWNALLLALFFISKCYSVSLPQRNGPLLLPQRHRKVSHYNRRHPSLTLELNTRSLVILRGGGEDSESDDEMEELEEKSIPIKIVGLMGKIALRTLSAFGRGLQAAFTSAEETDEPKSTLGKVLGRITRVVTAILLPSSESPNKSTNRQKDEIDLVADVDEETDESRQRDFGDYLSKIYKIEATRKELGSELNPVLGGQFMEAMSSARSQARLLVVFIPAGTKPGKLDSDSTAVESFLSTEVARVAERKARKSAEGLGSFILWSAKPGSSEAATALKRLKAQPVGTKGQKRPILAVAYLAQVIGKQGVPRMVPRLLAQHHCSPPPDAQTMAAWLNALRKRHAKQYISMQTELKEISLYKERKAGYKESVKSDVQRKQDEKRLAAELAAKAAEEAARQEVLKKRRQDLLDSLPEEPDASATDTKTVALRFADGRSGRRRFGAGTSLETLFNWVDAEFELERELVILTTMNGRDTFSWEDDRNDTLQDRGLPKMVGLRVSIAQPKTVDEDQDDEVQVDRNDEE